MPDRAGSRQGTSCCCSSIDDRVFRGILDDSARFPREGAFILRNRSLVLVAGSIAANYLNGGIAWERLLWILGLKRLGFDVFVVDQLDRGRCVFPDGTEQRYENCLNLGYFERIVKQFALADSAVLLGDRGEVLHGPSYGELLKLAEAAEMLVNVAGNLRLE